MFIVSIVSALDATRPAAALAWGALALRTGVNIDAGVDAPGTGVDGDAGVVAAVEFAPDAVSLVAPLSVIVSIVAPLVLACTLRAAVGVVDAPPSIKLELISPTSLGGGGGGGIRLGVLVASEYPLSLPLRSLLSSLARSLLPDRPCPLPTPPACAELCTTLAAFPTGPTFPTALCAGPGVILLFKMSLSRCLGRAGAGGMLGAGTNPLTRW